MAHGDEVVTEGPLTVNKLSGDDALFTATTGGWSATNANLTVDFDNKKYATKNSLRITPTAYDPIVLTLTGYRTTLEEANDNIDFHCWYKAEQDSFVTIELSSDSELSATRSFNVAGGIWNVIRAEPVDVPLSSETYGLTLTITIADHGGQPILITNPTLYQEYRFTLNPFLKECVPLIPRVFTEIEKQQKYPTMPMYRMMEVGLTQAGVAFEQQQHFRYRDIAGGQNPNDIETLSGLVDPTVADVRFLPWLSQFTGTQYIDPTIRTTPWGNLPANWQAVLSDIDPTPTVSLDVISLTRASGVVTAVLDGDVTQYSIGETVSVSGAGDFDGQYLIESQDIGTSTIGWSQAASDDTASTGTVDLVDQSWIELESFRIDITNRIEFLRWQVQNQYYGVRAGTLEALSEATKFYLTGSKTVNIFAKHMGTPFLIKIYTKTSETPGGVEGEQSEELVQALQNAKPAGFKIVHECNSTGTDNVFLLGTSAGVLGESLL
jgi:hypothetical protein